MRKFVRRNRAALTIALVVAVAMLLGIVGTTWQAIQAVRQRDRAVEAEDLAQTRLASESRARQDAEAQRQIAEENFGKARQAVDEYFTLVSETKLLDVPGLQPLRKELLNAALRFYEKSARERSKDPAVLADLAATHLRAAVLYHSLDRNDDAVTALRKALDLADQLFREHPLAAEHHKMLAGFQSGLRRIQASSVVPTDVAGAHQTLVRAIELWEKLVQQYPNVVGFQSDLAFWYRLVADLQITVGQDAAANSLLQKARPILERLASEYPRQALYREELARCYQMLAGNLRVLNRGPEAGEFERKAQDLREQLVRDFPGVPQYRADLASSADGLAKRLQQEGEFVEAEAAVRRSLGLWQGLANEFETVPHFQQQLALAYQQLTWLLTASTNRPDRDRAYRQALAEWEQCTVGLLRSIADRPDAFTNAPAIVNMLTILGNTLNGVGRLEDADKIYRQALALHEQHVAKFGQEPEQRHRLLEAHFTLGMSLHSTRPKIAEAAYRKSLALGEDLVAAFPTQQRSRWHLAWIRWYLADLRWANGAAPGEVEQLCRSALVELEKLMQEVPDNAAYRDVASRCCQTLAELLQKTGRLEEAMKAYGSLIELAPANADAHHRLAWILATNPDTQLRNPVRAVELAKKAVELAPNDGASWRSLGVAQYQTGDWKGAVAGLQKSMELRAGGDSFDWFFLAMAHWQLGDKDEARKWYEQAVEWMEKYKPNDEELRRFRAEAAELLGVKEQEKE